MKNYLLIIMLGLASIVWSSAIGQGAGTLTTIPSNGNRNMVRYDAATGDFIVASSLTGGVIHFIKTDLTNYKEVKIQISGNIFDFEIIDRFIFFCGSNASSTKGILGWFNIDTLFAFGGNTYIDMDLYTMAGVTLLQNIEVFKKISNSYHIAGYGRDASLDYVAFEAVGHPYTGMQCRTLLLEYDNSKSDILDMTVTDNYVVYLRHETFRPCNPDFVHGLTLIPFEKYDMFNLPIDSAYFFQTSVFLSYGGIIYPENVEPAGYGSSNIVHTEGDIVAVCAYRRDNDFLNCYLLSGNLCDCENAYVRTYLTLRHYDMSPLASNRPVVMTSAYAAQLVNGATGSVPGFGYDNSKRCYVALHNQITTPATMYESGVTVFDFTGGVPSFTRTEYQTAHSTITEWTPYGLCIDNSSRYLVSGAEKITRVPYYFWMNNVSGSAATSCSSIIYNPVIPLPLIQYKGFVNVNTPAVWTPLSFLKKGVEVLKDNVCTQLCQ